MKTLQGKVAIVTGARGGIGYAAARLFAAEGASLIVAGRRQQQLDRLIAELAAAGEPRGMSQVLLER